MEYRIDFRTGEYVCGKCGKRMKCVYYKGERRRTITKEIYGLPMGNLRRHLEKCYFEENRRKKDELIRKVQAKKFREDVG